VNYEVDFQTIQIMFVHIQHVLLLAWNSIANRRDIFILESESNQLLN